MAKQRLISLTRAIILSAIIIFIIFIIGCAKVEEKAGEAAAELNGTAEEPLNPEPITETVSCTPEWQCLDSKTKAYQLENCSYTQQKECPSGCGNGTCIVKTCVPGWKCKGDYYKGYQIESCEWIKKSKCEFGCENASCRNASIEGDTMSEEETVAVPTYETLVMGETKAFTINDQEHNLSIFNIGEEGVQIYLDSKRSPWLTEDSNYSAFGVTVNIKDVFFQSYPGGKREITYRVE